MATTHGGSRGVVNAAMVAVLVAATAFFSSGLEPSPIAAVPPFLVGVATGLFFFLLRKPRWATVLGVVVVVAALVVVGSRTSGLVPLWVFGTLTGGILSRDDWPWSRRVREAAARDRPTADQVRPFAAGGLAAEWLQEAGPRPGRTRPVVRLTAEGTTVVVDQDDLESFAERRSMATSPAPGHPEDAYLAWVDLLAKGSQAFDETRSVAQDGIAWLVAARQEPATLALTGADRDAFVEWALTLPR